MGIAALVVLAGLVFGLPSVATAAGSTPLVSTSTSDSGGSVVGNGTVLTVNFSAAPVLAGSYSLTLTDGTHVATLSSAAATLTGVVTGTRAAFTVHGATSLSLSVLEVLSATGVSDGSGNAWNLVASGQVDEATSCVNIAGFTRVFRGSNCQITRPVPPAVFDVIALPTADLPGPPDDNAPEVITNCQAGSTDTAYDLNSGAALGTNPCGNNPPEQNIGNTNSNTLDYIPTPKLASFEEAGVIETIPGSTYVSATSVPVQFSAITVSGNKATFTYDEPVVCQAKSGDRATISQFTYATPATNLSRSGLVYASGITCPSSAGATSITVTWPNAIPVSSGVRFKYEGYGQGHFIVGAPRTLLAGAREASQSAFVGSGTGVGPSPTISSFTPAATTLPTSAGGSVNISYVTTNAVTCSLAAVSQPTTAAALTLPSVASCNGTGAIGVPANASQTSPVTYTVTLTANGAAGTTAATAPITITVPSASAPPPVQPAVTGVSPASGPVAGGTTVTVTGSGFTGASKVAFGAVAATSFTVVSGTQITAVSPAQAAASYDITVTTAAGTSPVVSADSYTYQAAAQPAVTGVSPASGPVAGETTVTVTGSGFTGASKVAFGAVAATSFTVVSGTQITAVSPAQAAASYDITVTTAAGTSPVVSADSYTYQAAAQPAVTGVSPASGPVAGGTTVTVTGSGFTGASKVAFGAVAATSFTVVSGTQITAVSPAQAAASYDITVTTAAGTSPVVSADSYTYQAATGPPGTLLVSTSTTDSGGSVVGNGTVLTVGFNEVPVLSGSYSLTLTDGSHVVTLSSAAGTLSGVATGTSVAFTAHGATSLALSELEVLASSGVSDGSGNAWDLVASGQVDEASSCVNIAGFTRVFRGSNCQIGGPVPPAVFDVIALPTADLPGPPDDNAPEVITNCQAGSTDTAYDLNSGAALGANPCGHNPNETAIGNTNSNTLDYIPTPNLASFEEVGVIETIPGSTYVSATSVPVQLSAITVSGNKATFTYDEPVVCQGGNTDPATISQFTYATPYNNLNRSGLVYASAISCPPSGGATSITVTWPSTIPVSSGLRFKYEGYGAGHFIVGAPATLLAGAREASQSAYVGPSALGPH